MNATEPRNIPGLVRASDRTRVPLPAAPRPPSIPLPRGISAALPSSAAFFHFFLSALADARANSSGPNRQSAIPAALNVIPAKAGTQGLSGV